MDNVHVEAVQLVQQTRLLLRLHQLRVLRVPQGEQFLPRGVHLSLETFTACTNKSTENGGDRPQQPRCHHSYRRPQTYDTCYSKKKIPFFFLRFRSWYYGFRYWSTEIGVPYVYFGEAFLIYV